MNKPPANWYAQAVRKIHFDMHTPETVDNVGRDFDPPAFARAIRETGAEAVCFFSRCAYGWSYYPTQVGLPHPHLARDLFGEGVAALKAEGIRVLAYYAIDNIPAPMAEQHPEWRSRKPDGSFAPGHGNGSLVCVFSPFPEQMLIPQFREIAERYPVDGFFLDGVYQYFHNVCYCESCRRAFGRDIPQKPDDPAWRAWRHAQVQRVWDVMGRAAEEVARVRPGCLLGVNWLSSVRWSVPPPPSLGYLTGDPPLHNCSFETAFNLAAWAWRDRPADLMTERMLHHWQDFTCRTPETIETEFATGLACGGKLFVGDLLPPAAVSPDPEVLKLFRRCFTFAAERQGLAEGVKPKADIAILSSPETLRGRGNAWTVDETPLRGAYLALVEDGLAADILYDDDIADRLRRYRVLVVPEQRFLGREAARTVRAFVRAGGRLVVLGALPRAVDPAEPDDAADRTQFEELTGLVGEGEHDFGLGYLTLRGTPAEGLWREGDDFRPAIPVPGRAAKVRATAAEVLARITAPGETYQIGAKPPGELLDAPALTLHRSGKGTVAFCALPLATDIWKRGNPGAKYVLQRLVRRVAGRFRVERLGPPCVQMTYAEGRRKTIVHLVAYQPDRRTASPQTIESPPAISGVQVRIGGIRRGARASVRIEPGGARPKTRRLGSTLVVDVPPFTIHAALTIQWA